jgi:(p)ppGpp synthase/HD superfamily hydrolase
VDTNKPAVMIAEARLFATAAHAAVGQLRKYTGEAYIVHPKAVAKIVAGVPGSTPEMIAAAWLHDVVEDTGVTIDLIREEFGDEVADLVGWLTDISKPGDGNRAHRKAMDREHSAAAPQDAQTIKLADIIENTASIEDCDPDFAIVFRREKRALLAAMTGGDPALRARALAQIPEERKPEIT